jgi:hypothetical protein
LPRSHRVHLICALIIAGCASAAHAEPPATQPTTQSLRSRLDRIETLLPDFKRQFELLRSDGQEISYPQVSFTVLENFTPCALKDLKAAAEKTAQAQTSNSLQDRVARELPDMEKMADRLAAQLNQASDHSIELPRVPRWDGKTRPKISGPSFLDAHGRPIFFIGYGHFDQVRKDIEKFPAYGINIVQHAEFGPSAVFPTETQVDDSAVTRLCDELDRAAKAGVAVDWLLSPHYVPEWLLAKYPRLRKRRTDFLPFSIYAPQARDLVCKFIRHVVPKIKDKPALLSICLSNEPINLQEPDSYSIASWRAWLKDRHHEIATLNSRWKSHYASFDEIPQPNPLGGTHEPHPGPAWCDFCRWNQEAFASFHQALADAVHEVAPDVPVHIKATTWHMYRAEEIPSGDDPTLLDAIGQINGNDSVNLWSFNQRAGDLMERGTRDFAQGWRENALAYELQRSTLDAPVFNSENHLIFDRETRYVSPDHIRAALWMGAIHGQSATTLWVWQREMSNPHGDFAGDIMERASCAEAVGTVCLDLNRAAPQVTAIQKAPPDVLILQDNSAAVWEQAPYGAALEQAFTALSFTGLKIGFLTERQLERGTMHQAPLLIIPDCVHLSDSAFDALLLFKGQILFVGGKDLLSKNEYDQTRDRRVPDRMRLKPVASPRTWQELLVALRTRLAEANVRPAMTLLDSDGKPQAKVQWQLASTPDGIVINLYNASHDPATVRIDPPAAMTNVLSSQNLPPGAPITLRPMQVMLLQAKPAP